MGCHSPLLGWRNRDTGGLCFKREMSYGEKMEVACGQCLGCRLDYSRMWAMRIVHEASLYEYTGGNSFVTLTYRDMLDCDLEQCEKQLYVPDDFSLHKSHFQKFMKRLRKAFPDREIRYFYAGEYGKKCKHGIDLERVGCPLCNTGRPHFHAALFNITFDDLEAYQSDGAVTRYTSPKLEKIWGYGFVDVADLTFSSAAYISKYILKKVGGVMADDHYCSVDMTGEIIYISPEFVGMSRGNASSKGQLCGIGAKWYEKYKDEVFGDDGVPVPGHGMVHGVPRYYEKILREEDEATYNEMKEVRKAFLREHADEYTPARLMDKHKCAKAKVKLADERKKVHI